MRNDLPRTLLAVSTAGTGLLLFSRPDAVGRWASGTAVSGTAVAPPRAIVRALGARYTVQGLTQLLVRDQRVTVGSVAGDGLHLATMLLAASRYPAHRRAALLSGALAATAAVGGTALLQSSRRSVA